MYSLTTRGRHFSYHEIRGLLTHSSFQALRMNNRWHRAQDMSEGTERILYRREQRSGRRKRPKKQQSS